jgi:hypothetical protein
LTRKVKRRVWLLRNIVRWGPLMIVGVIASSSTHSLHHFLYKMAEARAARLAAVEARLAGTTTTPIKNVEKKVETSFEPTEIGDMEKKKEFTKLLFRGVVRDNGYREAMACVDVSLLFLGVPMFLLRSEWRWMYWW